MTDHGCELDELTTRLRAAGCVYAEDEAALLLAEPSSVRSAMVARRVAGEPLEYVLGWVELGGVRLSIDRGVFIPRQRTKLLIDVAYGLLSPEDSLLDLCCGSGAIGVLLAGRLPGLTVTAADIDPIAVENAARNLAPFQGLAVMADLFDGIPEDLRGTLAVITANVPYIPTAELAFVTRDAREHEPTRTHDGGADGLRILEKVARGAGRWLAPGGSLLSECAIGQIEQALGILELAGLNARVHQDGETAVVIGARV